MKRYPAFEMNRSGKEGAAGDKDGAATCAVGLFNRAVDRERVQGFPVGDRSEVCYVMCHAKI
jgi:hypothetical protein